MPHFNPVPVSNKKFVFDDFILNMDGSLLRSEKKEDDIALSLVRHEEAWWIVNHSDELCCAVNEQVMEPHHRMRLN
ncbi:hypothetical protein MJI46_33305, partial [Salmonella enterica subsp. enterica serovar Cerro]|nr:hypothetical protein [Salmonella enterica subsp. enterica serovar Cerro]